MFSGLSIDVIDPMNRTGKVSIPAHHITETKGLGDYRAAAAKREVKDFSLCLLFQKGRCNAGLRCHQIHAAPEFVDKLREQAASSKNCCAEHGDLHSHGYSESAQCVTILSEDGNKRYALCSFARTACLDNILRSVKSPELRIPASKICRLHSQRRCKFGRDCKNIHICPDAIEILPFTKGCPSIDMNMSCGISCRSSSKPSSLSDSPATISPRDVKAPLCVDDVCESATHGCSSFFFSDEKIWGSTNMGGDSMMTADLDMSAFEATIRILCDDLDRAEHSPASAQRVRSQGKLLWE